MDKLLELLTQVKEVLARFKDEELGPEYVVFVGMGILGAVLEIYAQVDINDGFVVVLTGLVVRLVQYIVDKRNKE